MTTKLLIPITSQANIVLALAELAADWREATDGDFLNAQGNVAMLLFDTCVAIGLRRSEMVSIFGEKLLGDVLDLIY